MKKIGFIDYYIDEWHANNYPAWIRKTGRDFDVALAWEEKANENGKALPEWCKEQQVEPAESMEQVIEECDALVVLAPSNPEVHERLAVPVLKSGKPVYVDKPFAQDLAMAKRLVDVAAKHNTPLMSSSALRFGADLQKAANETHAGVNASFVTTGGGGSSFWEYSIHQLEMLVMLMGTGAEKVMQVGNSNADHMLIAYPDQRRACMTLNGAQPFCLSAFYQDHDPVVISDMGDFWDGFIGCLLDFFETSTVKIPMEQTLEIISLVETGIKALDKPDTWITLEK